MFLTQNVRTLEEVCKGRLYKFRTTVRYCW